jgi:hypothetical protein
VFCDFEDALEVFDSEVGDADVFGEAWKELAMWGSGRGLIEWTGDGS